MQHYFMRMDVLYFSSNLDPHSLLLQSLREPGHFLYNSDCIHLKEESPIHIGCLRLSKPWGNFNFWVNYTFNTLVLNFTINTVVGHIHTEAKFSCLFFHF